MVKILIIILVIIVAAAGIVFIDGWRALTPKIKIGQELARKNEPYTQKLLESEHRILIMGDDIAAGVGASDPRDSIAGRFGQDFPDAYIINQGMPGRNFKELLADFPRYPNGHLKLTLIMAGTMDIINFTSLSHIRRDLKIAVGKAKLASERVMILHSGNLGLAPFFPRPLGWVMSWRARAVREIFKQVAKDTGAVYVDLYAARRDDPFLKDTARFYAADGLHLIDAGYGLWYQKIRAAMENADIRLTGVSA